MSIICPSCSADLPDDAVFCDQCGASLSTPTQAAPPVAPAAADETVCPQCGAAAIPGEAFCDNCGASLAAPEVVVPVEPSEPAAELVEPAAELVEPEVELFEPEVELVEPVVEVEAEPTPPGQLVQCPACGADNLPGSKFCSNCGIRMAPPVVEELPPAEKAVVAETIADEPEPAAGGEFEFATKLETEIPPPSGKPRFVVRDTGAEIVLPTDEGQHIVGREDPVSNVYPAVDLNPHDGEFHGVSRQHARLIVDAGLIFIEDLDSTNFTFVNRQKLSPKTPTALSNGDEVRLGKLVFTYLE